MNCVNNDINIGKSTIEYIMLSLLIAYNEIYYLNIFTKTI